VIFDEVEFQWDKWNMEKNWIRHRVSMSECEEVFGDTDRRVFDDIFHSENEKRTIIVGSTKGGRLLFVVFTQRSNKIRIISARDVNKKEEKIYEENSTAKI